ncbi:MULTISPECIES: A24 family peptidase [unclassified Sphingopyxis]|uniref:A24 family peptidase n=1 Tax=unclassified Sphingopyxis TaxID=2614943 RepID=UPI0007364EA9|nr:MULTISPECIES: prepilin peptidase [unclassified Sphingopyxis]KTE31491.1 peptidase [Sphingopyxis sp. HIX]KTE81896.1 peptidase [Sphingopyxis sp. HXXIV]
MAGHVTLLILMTLAAILMACSAISDLRWREISNGLNGLIAAFAIPFWYLAGWSPWPDVTIVMGVAAATFAFFLLLYALGAMGGGDVKNVFAVFLWIPTGIATQALMVMALAGAAVSAAMLVHQIITRPKDKPEVPYGVAIAAAGLWALHQQYLNQFQVIGSS